MDFRQDRLRWVLEPSIGLLMALLIAGAVFCGAPTRFAIVALVIPVGVAVARVFPVAALFCVGVSALLLLFFGTTPRRPGEIVVLMLVGVGVATIFGLVAAFGPARAAWVAFGGAALLFLMLELGFLDSLDRLMARNWLPEGGALVVVSSFVIPVLVVITVGPWCLGYVLRRRARAGHELSPVAHWVMAPVSSRAFFLENPLLFPAVGVARVRFDVVVAVVFFLFCGMSLGTSGDDILIVAGLFSVALGLRRFSPLLALAISWIAAILQMSAQRDPSPVDIVVLGVLYTTASYGSRGVRLAGLISAGAGALIGTIYLTLRAGGFGRSEVLFLLTVFLAVFGLSWTLGLLARTWRQGRQSRAAERAEHLMREQAEHTVALEHERNQIARDVHDVVAHSLAVVIAQADGARYLSRSDPGTVDVALRAIATTSRSALADVRVLLSRLRHDETDSPAPDLNDIDRVVEQIRSSGLTVEVVRTGLPVTLAAGTQLAVFRIVQEALTNALRHGDAREIVRVRLEWIHAGLEFSITNTVRLLAPGSGGLNSGHGLDGIRERAYLAGGSLVIHEKNRLFVVEAFVPGISHATGLLLHNRVEKDTQ